MSAEIPSENDNIKHLEFLQSTISRLTTNSFLLKGWTLTIAAAVLGFAVNTSSRGMSMVVLVTTIPFWLLDTYLLRQERLFRRLYDAVRQKDPAIPRFSMSTAPFSHSEKFTRVLFRPILSVFYCTLLAAAIATAILAPELGKLR